MTMTRTSLLTIVSLTVFPLSAPAQTSEHRDYQVLVNGKDAGSSRITIDEDKAGADKIVTVKVVAAVKFIHLFVPFSFSNETNEVWQHNKLVSISADSVENGTRTKVAGKADANGLVISVNGAPRALATEIWTSSFWKLPDAKFHNNKVPIFEPDTGNEMTGTLTFVGKEKLVAAGKAIDCLRFRLTGIPNPTELWYDQHHRLVRQQFTERGQTTIVQLVRVK